MTTSSRSFSEGKGKQSYRQIEFPIITHTKNVPQLYIPETRTVANKDTNLKNESHNE